MNGARGAVGVFLMLAAMAVAGAASSLPPPPVVPQVQVLLVAVPPVDVNRDSEMWVSTNGTVNISVPAWFTTEMQVYFNVTINETYWPATITPMSAAITGSGEVPFRVNVSVPGRASVDSNAVISVQANVSATPGFGLSFFAETGVPILQYFGLEITPRTSTSTENFTAQAGKDTGFSFRIQNLGNGRDSFELHVDNIAELQSRGISLYLPSPVTVAAKVTANVNGNVSVPGSVTEGNFTLSISGISTGAAAKGDTVTAAAVKRFQAVPADASAGQGPGPADTPAKGFVQGFEGPFALAAMAAVAAVGLRRVRRP